MQLEKADLTLEDFLENNAGQVNFSELLKIFEELY